MDIQFLFYRECPSHETALQRLKEIIVQEGVRADIEIIEVTDMEQARDLRFVGSPTILVNGSDIAPVLEDSVYGLTCRAYITENGRISPLPPESALRSAITNAGKA